MLQIPWERGFLDPSKTEKDYTISGHKGVFGNIMIGTSLCLLTESLLDFVQEDTLLQYHGCHLGVIVERTPKCHPELAGEGIEYCWGCAKGYYQHLPLAKKRGNNAFKESVKKSLCSERVLTTERVRSFSK